MKLDSCFLCGSCSSTIIHNGTRGGHNNINVLRCNDCGLVRLSEAIDNVDQFYQNSGMRDQLVETPEKTRMKTRVDDERRFLFAENMIEGKAVLDFGCGDGGFLCRAKNIASKIQGVELEQAMREGLNTEGIPCCASIDDTGKFDIITLFHVLEHLEDPLFYLEKFKEHLNEDGMILVEVPNADDALLSLYNSSAFADFTYWHCHIYLYNNETLKRLAQKAGLRVKFMQQIQRYPLANHLYWLTQRKPGGHQKWAFMNDAMINKAYGDLLSKLGIADTLLVGLYVTN